MEKLITIITLGLVVSGISFTLSVTSIFEWLRTGIGKIHPKLEELFRCPWCLSHYVAIIVMLSLNFFYHSFIDFIVYWFEIITISGIIHYILLRAYEPVAKTEAIRKAALELKRRKQEQIKSIR